MSFEMLGSRYLNPYFGSGIYTWAALISTVLIALMIGYFLGGWLADRYPKASVLGLMMLVSAIFMGTIPMMAPPIFDLIFDALESVAVGSLFAASFLIIPPLILLGGYSPFAIRLVLTDTTHSGRTSGLILWDQHVWKRGWHVVYDVRLGTILGNSSDNLPDCRYGCVVWVSIFYSGFLAL